MIGFTSTSGSLGHTPYDPHADKSPECQGEAPRKAARPRKPRPSTFKSECQSCESTC